MLSRIHINQHHIKKNKKCQNKELNVITVKDYLGNRKGNRAIILVDEKTVAEIVYRPEKPLSCGATCWIETEEKVIVS